MKKIVRITLGSIITAMVLLFISGCAISAKGVIIQPTSAPTAVPTNTPCPTGTPEPSSTPVSAGFFMPSGEKGNAFFITAAPQPDGQITGPVQTDNGEAENAAEQELKPDPEITFEPAEVIQPEGERADSVTIGAVGDIMVMPSQLAAAYDELTDTYSFIRTFTAMTGMFKATDLMCGNLEGAIAGKKAGYSNGVTDEEGRIRFNAPDEFAYDLKAVGFDVITTANNHAGDCEADGLIATINTVKAAGLYQTGTYTDAAAREIPLVIDVKGFKVGVLSSTTVINGTSKLTHKQKDTMFSRLQYFDMIGHDIELLKEAGAEFIVMFVHWDKEYKNAPQKSTKKYAQQLLEMGVDAVVGSHPHVVQPMTYMTVTRTDGSAYTGLVAYSLGNFLSNMTGDCTYELFLQLRLARDEQGKVVLSDAEYMPVLCYAEEVESVDAAGVPFKETVHQVIPCFENPELLNCYNGMNDKKLAAIRKAREYVLRIVGEGTVPVMEDACWIN